MRPEAVGRYMPAVVTLDDLTAMMDRRGPARVVTFGVAATGEGGLLRRCEGLE